MTLPVISLFLIYSLTSKNTNEITTFSEYHIYVNKNDIHIKT